MILRKNSMFKIFDDIEFEETAHKYKFKSRPDLTPTSVTTVLGRYNKPFDTQYWAKRKANDYGISTQEVIDKWDKDTNFACDKGTVSHLYMECSLTDQTFVYEPRFDYVRAAYEHNKVLMDRFLKESSKSLIPVVSELVVGDTEYNITGMIDQVYKDKDGFYYLFDWKTNKKIDKTSNYRLQGILSELDSSKHTQYSLQLLLYKHLIEKNTNIKIKDSYICWFGPKETNYHIYKVKDLESYIPMIIEDFIKENS